MSSSSKAHQDMKAGPFDTSQADPELACKEGVIDEDVHFVDWDGPDDPKNPRNWSSGKKLVHVLLVSGFTLYSNLAAVMFAPGAQDVAKEFRITSTIVESLTVTIYLLGFCLGPLILSSLSETYGRLIVYHICNMIFIGLTVGCALSTDAGMFLAFRLLCGVAASSPMAIGGGTIADLYVEAERGKAMAIFGMGPLLGPVIGPVIGGFVSQDIGWRWTFWLILILSSVISLLSVIFLRETYEPALLSRKAARLCKKTGNPKLCARTLNKNLTPSQILTRSIMRPTKMIFLSPIVFLISIYCAFMFSLLYLLFTTFPDVFEKTYGWGPEISGLSYLGLGIGMMFSIALFGLLSDKLLKQPRGGTVARPELRLILMMWCSPLVPIGFIWYGWSAKFHAHWIISMLGTGLIGISAFLIMMPAQLYLVDSFGTEGSASALAGNTVLRSLFAALLPLAGPDMYARLGLGWGNTLLGFIAFAFVPVPWLFFKYGEYLRTRFPLRY
ncbi:MFS transporter [Penicillium malachiteum]|uniref:MFS transporter n=1 Tax=Penicillium malachiteum TaxID=1324776 RepID=UPI002547CD35|nr:MFS transporter [Penicillium malachiteum]KAJ5728542.1 MFS transporter [Penicillium malachiteum]